VKRFRHKPTTRADPHDTCGQFFANATQEKHLMCGAELVSH